jgi:hypothetical protein
MTGLKKRTHSDKVPAYGPFLDTFPVISKMVGVRYEKTNNKKWRVRLSARKEEIRRERGKIQSDG